MRVLIAGLGFVGEALALRLHEQGHDVLGITHSVSSAERLRDQHAFGVRASDLSDLEALRATFAGDDTFDRVLHCASSGRGGAECYEAVYCQGVKNLLALFPSAKLYFTSSTSVYGQTDGGVVDETSPAEPDRETGRILRQTEERVIESGGVVARLAGIYGPGRSYILLKFLQQTASIEGDGARYLNQVHQSDIVSALALLMGRKDIASDVVNVVDSTAQTQREVYQWLAEHFNGELPPFVPPDLNRKRGWTHKQVSNAKLLGLGWKPKYPSFQDAILHDPELVASIRAMIE